MAGTFDPGGAQIGENIITYEGGDRNCLRIYNVFTANKDGLNDTWIIENLEYYPEATVKVYNPSTASWDGILHTG